MTLPPVLPYFPSGLLPEGAVQFDIFGETVSGGQTLGGAMPIGSTSGGGLWKATLATVPVRTREQVQAWRAVAAICKGGAQPIIVPACESRYMPAPLDANGRRVVSYDAVLHAGDNPFLGGHGYNINCVAAAAAAAADLRATTISITILEGSDLIGGEHFSVDDSEMRWRMYRIMTVLQDADDNWACTIEPPLRAPLVAGAHLRFDKPRCVMRLATPSAMDLMLDMRKRAKPTVSFIEAFPEFP